MKACPTKKQRLATRKEAAQALYDVVSRRFASGRKYDKVEKRFYLCPKCGGYHLTAQSAKHKTNDSELSRKVVQLAGRRAAA